MVMQLTFQSKMMDRNICISGAQWRPPKSSLEKILKNVSDMLALRISNCFSLLLERLSDDANTERYMYDIYVLRTS